MKKITLGILLFLSTLTLEALPLGNPTEPNFLFRGVFWGGVPPDRCDPCALWIDSWDIRVGYWGNFVFDRNLRLKNGNGDDIHNTRIITNAAYAVLNIANWVDIFGTAGVTKLTITQVEASWDTTLILSRNSLGTLTTNSDFSWSVGARFALPPICNFVLGAEGQYFRSRLDWNRYDPTFFLADSVFFDHGNKANYSEWQGALGLSYTITCSNPFWKIIPYAGLKFSQARLDSNDFQIFVTDLVFISTRVLTIFNMKEQRNLGYSVGVTLTAWGNSALTLEGSWASEKALHFNAQFRY